MQSEQPRRYQIGQIVHYRRGGPVDQLILCLLSRRCTPHIALRSFDSRSLALALVRRQLWTQTTFPTSLCNSDVEKVPQALLMNLADLHCSAA